MSKATEIWAQTVPKSDDDRIAVIKRIVKETGDIPEGLLYEISHGAKDAAKVLNESGRKLTRAWE